MQYSEYVYSAVLITLVVLALNAIVPLVQHRLLRKRIARLHNAINQGTNKASH